MLEDERLEGIAIDQIVDPCERPSSIFVSDENEQSYKFT